MTPIFDGDSKRNKNIEKNKLATTVDIPNCNNEFVCNTSTEPDISSKVCIIKSQKKSYNLANSTSEEAYQSKDIYNSYIQDIHRRSAVTLFFIILVALGLILRLFWIQVLQSSTYQEQANKQHWGKKILPSRRGTIYDRNNRVLAISVPCMSCYADPKIISNTQITSQTLSAILKMEATEIESKLLKKNRRFVWLKRFLQTNEADQIQSLKLSGIFLQKESKREYPYNSLASHILGFVGQDHKGLEGIEAYFDEELSGEDGFVWTLKDGRRARWNIYHPEMLEKPAKNGSDLYLTIDINYQSFMEQELDKSIEEYEPISACAVLLDVETGEVLAMASRPNFDPNHFTESPTTSWRNHAISDAYELGSVMKPFPVSAALAQNIISPETIVFCHYGSCRIIPGRTLKDSHGYGNLSVEEVLIHSSNIGTAKIGIMLGAEKLCSYLEELGFGKKTGIELPGEENGMLKPANKWTNFTLTSVPMGHEICVTPLQMTSAYLTLAGNGTYRKPTLVQKLILPDGQEILQKIEQPKRIYPNEIAEKMHDILRQVVARGTAKKANIKEVAISGKTGTAQKLVNKEYSHEHFISVFVGFAPSEHPEVCCLVMLDEPKGSYYGGSVAAPIIANIFKRVLFQKNLNKIK